LPLLLLVHSTCRHTSDSSALLTQVLVVLVLLLLLLLLLPSHPSIASNRHLGYQLRSCAMSCG
jgi:hypothetical protein